MIIAKKLKLLIFQNNYALLFLQDIKSCDICNEAGAVQLFAEFYTKWKRFSLRKVLNFLLFLILIFQLRC